MVVETTLISFTAPEQALFHREISIDSDDKKESLRVRIVVARDPDDNLAVAIRRWSPVAASPGELAAGLSHPLGTGLSRPNKSSFPRATSQSDWTRSEFSKVMGRS